MHIIFCLILLTTLPLNAQTPSDQYQGFTGYWLKNNRAEAFALAGAYPVAAPDDGEEDRALLEVVEKLEALWAPEFLLITLGAHGIRRTIAVGIP